MYDVAVIGGGAAAHGAALYAMRYQLQTIMVIEEFGGETATASVVENYPGHVSIDGFALIQSMETQVTKLGAEVLSGKADRVERRRGCFEVGAPLVTAYPRRSRLFADPAQGLASVEALYAALAILGRPRPELLEGYRWASEFLRANPELG